jgi:hypothetical protein
MTELDSAATEGWREELHKLVPDYEPEDVPDDYVYECVLRYERPDVVEWLCEFSGIEPDWRAVSWAIRHADADLFWFLWRRGIPWTNRDICLSDADCEFAFETDTIDNLLVTMAVTSVLDYWGGLATMKYSPEPDSSLYTSLHIPSESVSLDCGYMLADSDDDIPATLEKYDCGSEEELRDALRARVTAPELLSL